MTIIRPFSFNYLSWWKTFQFSSIRMKGYSKKKKEEGRKEKEEVGERREHV